MCNGVFSWRTETVVPFKVETINSFENWKQNLLYTSSLDRNSAPFLANGVQWLKSALEMMLRFYVPR